MNVALLQVFVTRQKLGSFCFVTLGNRYNEQTLPGYTTCVHAMAHCKQADAYSIDCSHDVARTTSDLTGVSSSDMEHDVAGGSWSDFLGQERSPRSQQLTPGRPATALTPPATQGMWGSTLDLTLAGQQGSTGPPHLLNVNSNVARGAAALGGANATPPISQGGMHVSRSRKASKMGADTTTALANALSGIR